MTDYIKREDAINMVRNTFTGMTADTLELRINDIPSADVAPVRRGRWESFEDVFMETCYQCSECGLSFYLADGGTPKENEYHYCPNCGAKMDGGKE